MRILGISAFYHDSAAALIMDGKILAAAQEERFSRKKHDAGFPSHAVEYCLSEAGVSLADIDYVAFYEKPFVKFERLLETYLTFAPRGFRSFAMAMPLWLKEKLFQKRLLRDALRNFDPGFDVEAKLLSSGCFDCFSRNAFRIAFCSSVSFSRAPVFISLPSAANSALRFAYCAGFLMRRQKLSGVQTRMSW